ncbi:MAG: hypothetical protein ACM3ME_01155 [Chloroflexota bacterium]
MRSLNDIFYLMFVMALMGFAIFMLLKKKKEKSIKQTGVEEEKPKIGYKPEEIKDCEVSFVQEFLDFEKIANNMIVRENGSVFTMVIHCSGINFDLMSGNEKMMIEEGFIEFLNFIRFPIQLYVQTRKVDLKDSMKTYDGKIARISEQMKELVDRFDEAKANAGENQRELELLEYEIRRKQNLLDYATDLKENIEMMSINSNILQHRYYVVLSYHIEELGMMVNFSEEEVIDMVHTELFTRCRGIISVLAGCDIDAQILDSNGLAELLYMAFNRDDAEIYRLKDSMEAGFYRLYSSTEDSMEIGNELFNLEEKEDESEVLLLTESMELDPSSFELLIASTREDT